ncbi:MAG: DUF3307 domain-containing protein [Solirubrobacteraceae bacterium]|nr:DUF3307 domain-containing protein [Solirubrobacteraceae bacterium]
MNWAELFIVLIAGHLVGDFILQTEWQAVYKSGGLSGDRTRARALWTHVAWYSLSMLPALIWIAQSAGGVAAALGAFVVIAVPHAIQDDRRLLAAYARRVKHMDPDAEPLVMLGLDQSFHTVALLLTALAFAS